MGSSELGSFCEKKIQIYFLFYFLLVCLGFKSLRLVKGTSTEQGLVDSNINNPPQISTNPNTEWLEEQIDHFLTQAEKNGEPVDVQVSSCKISGQQLVATAQATIARALKGVCNPSGVEDKVHNLATQLGDQLNVIKTMVIKLEEKVSELDQNLKRSQKLRGGNIQPLRKLSSDPITSTIGTLNDGDENSIEPSVEGILQNIPRYDEMTRYNSTVSIENGRRVFSYYWIVIGINYKLSNWNLRRIQRSPSFYIFPEGYRMYLKIIPRYTSTTMYIHTGLTRGDYDNVLSWPFQLKIRISVLSMEDEIGNQDLKSRIWDTKILCSGTNWMKPIREDNPECLGLGFPHEAINSSEYIHRDRIIIKLSVYLD